MAAGRPVSASRIASIGPATTGPSPAVQSQSVAANRSPRSRRAARNGYRSGQTRLAAVIAAPVGIERSRPSGMAMSWPCTRTSMSGSRCEMPGAFRRDPAIARNWPVSRCAGSLIAWRRAVS